MSWASALRKTPAVPPPPEFFIPQFPIERIDWPRLVSLDFETFYDDQYTLSKLSTSEYIRDPRFEALMVGVKVGRRPRKVIPGPKIGAELAKVDWKTHSLLCHNTHFDGLILSHHYKIVPRRYYCSLSMARGLHSNEIGAGLDEVAVFYGRAGKLKGTLEQMKGRRYKDLVREGLYDQAAEYCGVDVDEMLGIFEEMARKMPVDEMDLIDLTCRMFCDPVLLVDIPRVQAELERERDKRRKMFTTLLRPEKFEHVLKGKEKLLEGDERTELITKRVIGSNEQFADLLRIEGIEPPVKISPAWMKKSREERTDAGKYTYAFAKTDLDFIGLPNNEELIRGKLDPATAEGVMRISSRQEYIRRLVEARLAVKSTSNISRAERFLVSGAHGMRLPVGYAYYRAHCLTGDAQVLTRLGWVALASWSGGEIAQWSEDGSVRFEIG